MTWMYKDTDEMMMGEEHVAQEMEWFMDKRES